jgi:Zn-dependent protease
MDFFNTGIPVGRYFDIPVRLHFTFVIFAFYRIQAFTNLGYGFAYVGGLYLCILLHEFGHALAARWCDGEADQIILWPLGGLAFCRPAFHPTAHLITTVAGPFVTLVLWLMFWGLSSVLETLWMRGLEAPTFIYWFVQSMRVLNGYLLVFNMVPAFPMDGGRILRDTLWHWMNAEKATRIAIIVSRITAGSIGIWALFNQEYWLLMVMGFIFFSSTHTEAVVDFEGRGTYSFSLRERLQRSGRRRVFRGAISNRRQAEDAIPFHTCASCGLTDHADPHAEFRVCTDCSGDQEYCADHIDTHDHR